MICASWAGPSAFRGSNSKERRPRRTDMRMLIAGLLCVIPLSAADREFRDVVDAISTQFQTRPLHIPMFGLVNLVTYVARPAGTRHIDLAVFENLDSRSR